VTRVPDDLSRVIQLAPTAADAVRDVAATVIATEWPEFRTLTAETFLAGRDRAAVVDPSGFLAGALQADARIQYVIVGTIL